MLKVNQLIGFGSVNEPPPAPFPVVEDTALDSSGVIQSESFTADLPSGITAGDLLIFILGLYNEDTSTSTAVPSGWTRIVSPVNLDFVEQFDCLFRVATGSEGSTLSFSGADFRSRWVSMAYRISGATGNVSAATASQQAETQPNAPNHTPSWGAKNTLWIAAQCQFSEQQSQTAPTNYSNLLNVANVISTIDRPRANSARRFLNAASENPGPFGNAIAGSVAEWAAATIAIEPGEP